MNRYKKGIEIFIKIYWSAFIKNTSYIMAECLIEIYKF